MANTFMMTLKEGHLRLTGIIRKIFSLVPQNVEYLRSLVFTPAYYAVVVVLVILSGKYGQHDPCTSGQNCFSFLLSPKKKQVEKEAITSARMVHEGL